MSNKSIHNFWPFKHSEPRKTQVEVLDWIESLPSNIKYILCEVPVGGGKSPIALNVAGWASTKSSKGNGVIMTPQKVLQKQYEDSFDSATIASLYGKSNYTCSSKKTNCEIGSDIKPKCYACPYVEAASVAENSPNVVLNYKLGLLHSLLGESKLYRNRDIIIFDECHTLETHLTELTTESISKYSCEKYGVIWKPVSSLAEALYFMQDVYLPQVSGKMQDLKGRVRDILDKYEFSKSTPSASDIRTLTEYRSISRHHNAISAVVELGYEELNQNYALVKEQKAFKIKPLFGKGIFEEFVMPLANRFLFLSSTILDHKKYCADLGIPLEEVAFISMPSEFEVDNRPVFYMPTAKMNYGWDSKERSKDREAMLNKIIFLLNEQHPGDSGIIHTGNFNISKWLVESLAGKIPQHIMHHNADGDDSRDVVIDRFLTEDVGKPKVLLSPSLTEGLDLSGDLGRFAIVAKVPYLSLADEWVKRRMELSPEWYSIQAMMSIIQGSGRVVRSKEDWGHTYILDSSFAFLKKNMNGKIPKWWLDAYVKL